METPPPALQCLGGRPASPQIVADLGLLAALPAAAKHRLYQVLGPSLTDPVPANLEEQLDLFARAFTLDGNALARAVRVSRFLLREAAALDLPAPAFAEDLKKLATDESQIGPVLLAGYEQAKVQVRSELARRSLADHGKLLETVDWRVDQVAASNRGEKLRLPVALLTFGYREGPRQRRITLQVLPATLHELRRICDRLL